MHCDTDSCMTYTCNACCVYNACILAGRALCARCVFLQGVLCVQGVYSCRACCVYKACILAGLAVCIRRVFL